MDPLNPKVFITIPFITQIHSKRAVLLGLFITGFVWLSEPAHGAQHKPILPVSPDLVDKILSTSWPTQSAHVELKLRQLKQALSKNSFQADRIIDRIESLQKKLQGDQ